jgi:ABC-2 type transport system permease protein
LRKVLRIARREYIAAVHTKGFIIGLVIAPIIMGGGFIALAIFKDRVDTNDKVIALIDHSGVVAEAVVEAAEVHNEEYLFDESGKQIRPAYRIEILEPDLEAAGAQKVDLSDRVRHGDIHAFVEVGPEVLHPGEDPVASMIAYHAENAALDDVRRWVEQPINGRLRDLRLEEAGVDVSSMGDLFSWIRAEPMGLLSQDEASGDIRDAKRSSEARAFGVPFFIVMIMFLITMMGAVPLLQAVMEEKNQRIAEVMLGSVKPFEFMMGKVLGGVGVSMTASVVYVAGGIYAFRHFGLGEGIPYSLVAWFFVYMLLNIVMLGSILAALGSTCNDAKEAQSVTMPAMAPLMVPMFVIVPIATQPVSGFATVLSLIPIFTPIVMTLRVSTTATIPAWQPWVGLVGVMAFALLAVWIGGRIFRVGILMQGKPPHLPSMIRWVLRG